MIRTRLQIISLLCGALFGISTYSNTPQKETTPPLENYESGKAKILAIMANDETGIAAYNKKHMQYAKSLNLQKDLNVPKISEFFGCKTIAGQQFIAETLKNPVGSCNREIITRRQAIIALLVTDPVFKKQIEDLLVAAADEEQEVIKMFSEFFIGKTCPELKNLELMKQQNPALHKYFNFLLMNKTGKVGLTLFQNVSALSLTAFTASLYKTLYNVIHLGQPYGRLAAYNTYMTLVSAFSLYGVYKDYSASAEKRIKLCSLQSLISIAEKLEKVCTQNSLVSQFKLSAINQEGQHLIKQLKSSRYKDKSSYVFNTPLVHIFLQEVYEKAHHLAELFACIAEFDAYNAIANKMLEAENNNKKFCFVTFIEQDKPSIQATHFWNILIPNPVTNSFNEQRNTILTGPNGGGKTATIRALLQNIVLGQTFGIAAADTFNCTLFDQINSYLNVSDDLIKGESLFVSEVKRAQEIIHDIKALEPDAKFFFALDELFTGTVAEDGEICAYEFARKLAEFNNIQFIYATHFAGLKKLAEDAPQFCNYKVNAPTKDKQGLFAYPFTLSKGASDVQVGLDIARQAQLFR